MSAVSYRAVTVLGSRRPIEAFEVELVPSCVFEPVEQAVSVPTASRRAVVNMMALRAEILIGSLPTPPPHGDVASILLPLSVASQ
ncbi:hypothetical protein GCM10022381_18790 [Leifsonia kafniensis]|uniref:Uncharacterized protein n=1 Tax=Leifsonia kafniensis TaxID=475957 RepID=A0ABP7KG12_9MICO